MHDRKPDLTHAPKDMSGRHSGGAQPAEPPENTGIDTKNAESFLAGETPGVMAAYAPDARTDPEEGWVESDETVEKLVDWREEAIY